MTQTEFTAEDNEFEYAGYIYYIKNLLILWMIKIFCTIIKVFLIVRHKLRIGDQGSFELCNLV